MNLLTLHVQLKMGKWRGSSAIFLSANDQKSCFSLKHSDPENAFWHRTAKREHQFSAINHCRSYPLRLDLLWFGKCIFLTRSCGWKLSGKPKKNQWGNSTVRRWNFSFLAFSCSQNIYGRNPTNVSCYCRVKTCWHLPYFSLTRKWKIWNLRVTLKK